MEKELNIAAILKEKPKGTKLWSPIFGECTFDEISCNDSAIGVDTTKSVPEVFYANGKYDENGDCLLFPSKEMRSWEKFAWKKGDVLTDNVSTICMFDGWANEDYTEFKAKYTLHLVASTNAENEVCKTNNFVSVLKEEDKQSYLATAETYFNVKLSKGLLEIGQPKQEFKDGDIVHYPAGDITDEAIFIAKVESKGVLHSYVYMSKDNIIPHVGSSFSVSGCLDSLRLATDSEKQQLFDALAKEGKVWNSETKQIEDLPKKCEFKQMDFVLFKNWASEEWTLGQYSHSRDNLVILVGGVVLDCNPMIKGGNLTKVLPYNDSTKHLLGTTDEWKGGEG